MIETSIFLHNITQLFLEGTNPVRAVLFILYVLLFVAGYCLLRTNHFSSAITRYTKWVLFGLLIVFVGSALFLQIHVFGELGISQTKPGYFFSESEFTFTHVMHSHFGKLALDPFIEAAGLSTLAVDADTGSALRTFVPEFVPYVLAALLFCIVFVSIFQGAILLRLTSGRWKKILYTLLYCLTAFICIAKSVDGGVVQVFGWCFLGFYGVLLFFSEKNFSRILCVIFAIATTYVIGLSFLRIGNFSVLSAVRDIVQLALIAAVLWSLHVSVYGGYSRRTMQYILGSVGTLVLLFAFFQAQEDLRYIHTPLHASNGYIVASYKLIPELPRVDSIGTFNLYWLVPSIEHRKETIGMNIEKFSLPWWYHPIVPIPQGCTQGTSTRTDLFMLGTKMSLATTTVVSKAATLHVSLVSQDAHTYYWYKGSVSYDSCMPNSLSIDILYALLKNVGGSTFSFATYRTE